MGGNSILWEGETQVGGVNIPGRFPLCSPLAWMLHDVVYVVFVVGTVSG